jgi:hypothetical protein
MKGPGNYIPGAHTLGPDFKICIFESCAEPPPTRLDREQVYQLTSLKFTIPERLLPPVERTSTGKTYRSFSYDLMVHIFGEVAEVTVLYRGLALNGSCLICIGVDTELPKRAGDDSAESGVASTTAAIRKLGLNDDHQAGNGRDTNNGKKSSSGAPKQRRQNGLEDAAKTGELPEARQSAAMAPKVEIDITKKTDNSNGGRQENQSGMTEEESRSIKKAIGDEGKWYLCENGHDNLVGNCGVPTESERCLFCGAQIYRPSV